MSYQVHNGKLCVSAKWLVQSQSNPNGFESYKNLKKTYIDGGKIKTTNRGCRGNELLIDFTSLPTEWQQKLTQLYGAPEAQAVAKPFKDKIEVDQAAKTFFKEYLKENGEPLPVRLQDEYSMNAAILNAIDLIFKAAQEARARAGKSLRNFWSSASTAITSLRAELNHTLPAGERRLKVVFETYKKEGYESLVSGRVGNSNGEKITGDILDWLTTEMANSRQSIEMVATRYPLVAQEKGWRTDITSAAFRKRVTEPEVFQAIALKRHGAKGFRKLFGQSFKIKKSQYRNDIWMGDGTALSWYYKSPVMSKSTGKFLHYAPVMATTYIVMDECSNKFLGWSTKEGINKENFEMQLEAFRAALRVSGSKPYQLLFDNQGGHKKAESKDFYSKLATVHFPTRAYRASGKSIERAFKNFQTLKLAEFPFWSGFGRPSHADLNYAPNMEWINKNIDSLPTFEELRKLLDVVIAEWNELGFNGAKSPNEIYEASRNPEEKPISIDDLSEMFWNTSAPKKYYAWGISHKINGEEIEFEVYNSNGDVDYNFRRKHLGQKVILKYDPDFDIKEVELYQQDPGGGLLKIANAQVKRGVSRSVKYHDQGDKEWIERQMKLEGEMIEKIESEMADMGVDDFTKANAWRAKIASTPAFSKGEGAAVTLYGDDEGSMEVIE